MILRSPILSACLVFSTACLIAPQVAAQGGPPPKTYFIEEVVDFTGNGCQATNVNTITALLDQYLESSGWSGLRLIEFECFPHDWREACSSSFGPSGLDSYYADDAKFTVYAGHGLQGGGSLFFGWPHLGVCNNILGTNSRLGSMAGKRAGYAMYLTSCTLKTTSLVAHANFQWTYQNIGFHNSPGIHSDSPAGWFNCTSGASNASCWLLWMQSDDQDEDTNTPIIVSYGATAAQANLVRDSTKMKDVYPGDFQYGGRPSAPSCGANQPLFFYNWVRIYNGTGDC